MSIWKEIARQKGFDRAYRACRTDEARSLLLSQFEHLFHLAQATIPADIRIQWTDLSLTEQLKFIRFPKREENALRQ